MRATHAYPEREVQLRPYVIFGERRFGLSKSDNIIPEDGYRRTVADQVRLP